MTLLWLAQGMRGAKQRWLQRVWVREWRDIAPMGAVLEGGYAPDRIRLAAGELVRAMAE